MNKKDSSMINAIVKTVSHALSACELTHISRNTIDITLARKQQDLYIQTLKNNSINLHTLSPDHDLPDSVFVEDAAIVLDELAIITRPGTELRRKETEAIAGKLKEFRQLEFIKVPATLDGGDVLKIGKDIYIGLSTRTNRDGIEQLSKIVEPFGYKVTEVPIYKCLHLKTGVTYIGKNTILINNNWINVDLFRKYNHLVVPENDTFGANSLLINDVVYMSERCKPTIQLLNNHGFKTKTLNISEFEKAEAGLTCLSIIF